MLSQVSQYIKKIVPNRFLGVPRTLNELNEVIYISDDEWNNVKNGNVLRTYFTQTNPPVKLGYIDYRVATGQIGLFYIEKKYHNNGLGKQMLTRAIDDIRIHGTATTVWGVTAFNHPVFSNMWNKEAVWKSPAHTSVTGSGYSCDLSKLTC
jgi:GNAT superfamily N-acetyltransferase